MKRKWGWFWDLRLRTEEIQTGQVVNGHRYLNHLDHVTNVTVWF